MNKIHNRNNNNLLLSYIFQSKKYINEFRQNGNSTLEFIHRIGGSLYLIYLIFYSFNYFINERIQLRNFFWFLNDKDNDFIQRHINYERNKIYSFKSNIYTNISNDIINRNEGFNSFKSTYFGNNLKNEIATFNNFNNDEINNYQKSFNNNSNYNIKIKKIDKDDIDNGKKSDNIIVINNNSFMNNNNRYVSNNSLEKNNSLKLVTKYTNLENINEHHKPFNKTFIYNRSVNDSESISKIKKIAKNNDLNFVKIKENSKTKKVETPKSRRNDSADFNSRHKIIDTSSVSLLNNNVNRFQNYFFKNPYYNTRKMDSPLARLHKNENHNVFKKLNTKIQETNNRILPKGKHSSKKVRIIHHNELYHHYSSKKSFVNDNSIKINKNPNVNKYTNIIIDNKERRKSHQPKSPSGKEKEENEKYKSRKSKTRKTGAFLRLPDNKGDRHLSLFSKNSVIPNVNTINPYDKTLDNISQIPIGKSFVEQNVEQANKKNSPINTLLAKKTKKKQSSDFENKSIKKNRENSFKNLNYPEVSNKFIKTIQEHNLSAKQLWKYFCVCNNTYGNNIYALNNFRNKLLSEEYLYILHINMFIYKQKYGCKSFLERVSLLEELYNDY